MKRARRSASLVASACAIAVCTFALSACSSTVEPEYAELDVEEESASVSQAETLEDWKKRIERANCDPAGVDSAGTGCKPGYYTDTRPPCDTPKCCIKGTEPKFPKGQVPATSFARSGCDGCGGCKVPPWVNPKNVIKNGEKVVGFTSELSPAAEVWLSPYGTGTPSLKVCYVNVVDALCLPPNAADATGGCLWRADYNTGSCTPIQNGASCGYRTCKGVPELPCTMPKGTVAKFTLVDNSSCKPAKPNYITTSCVNGSAP